MAEAENNSRKNRKAGKSADRLANAARLKALEDMIGVKIKRHRDPGNVVNTNPFNKQRDGLSQDKDSSEIVMKDF